MKLFNQKYLLGGLLFSLLFLITMPKVYANGCSDDDLRILRAKAKIIEIKYEYLKDYNPNITDDEEVLFIDNRFDIIIDNLTEEFYIEVFMPNIKKPVKIEYDSSLNVATTKKISEVLGGREWGFNIYVTPGGSCGGQLIDSRKLKIPYYNRFHNHELCQGIEDYKLCSLFISNNIFEDEFISKVTKYREQIKKDNGEPIISSTWNKVINWAKINLIYLVSAIVVIITVICIIFRNRFRRRNIL
jgi:hypothetical protein